MDTLRRAQPATAGAPDHLTEPTYRVVPRRYVGRWVTGAVGVVLAGLLLVNVFTNQRFGWDVVSAFLRDVNIGRGLWTTLWLTAACMALGTALAVVLAVMRLSVNPVLSTISFVYVWFFRGTPVLVQLLFWFNLAALYPDISFGVPGLHLNANQLITPT